LVNRNEGAEEFLATKDIRLISVYQASDFI